MKFSLLAGLATSGTYLLLALGFTLMLRIADVVNLAHGAFVVGGMYLTLLAVNTLGLPFGLAVAFAVVVGGGLAYLLYVLLLENARAQGHRPQIIYTILLLSLLQIIYQFLFGSNIQTLDIPRVGWDVLGVTLRREQVLGLVVAAAVCVLLFALFRYTPIGKSVEVAGKYEDGARAIGLPVQRLYRIVFVVGAGMALLAGSFIMAATPVTPFLSLEFLVVAVVIAIAARLSFVGCILASVLYGVGYQVLLGLGTASAQATVMIYALLLLIIALGPAFADVIERRRRRRAVRRTVASTAGGL